MLAAPQGKADARLSFRKKSRMAESPRFFLAGLPPEISKSSVNHIVLRALLFSSVIIFRQTISFRGDFWLSFDEREEEMNPLVWRHEHQVALMLGVVLGIVLGLAVGFSMMAFTARHLRGGISEASSDGASLARLRALA